MRHHPVFEKEFLVLGHRGMPGDAPENTMPSFQLARQHGANGIELDVRVCRTGELIVIHDARVNRTTDGRGHVRSLSLEQISRLRAISPDSRDAGPVGIPTLAEVFEQFARDMVINVEIKGYSRIADQMEEKVRELVAAHDAHDRVIVSSFNPIPLRRMRKLDERIATAFLIDRNFFVRRTEQAIKRMAGVDAIHLEASLARPELIERCRGMGLHCLVWGDTPDAVLDTILKLPLDGIITNHPDRVRERIARERN